MRERMKEVAADMLIAHGCAGFTFQQIATKLKCTRANVHYHFGTKDAIIEEVVIDYCARTLQRFHEIWLVASPLSTKIEQTKQFNASRYRNFNPKGSTNNPWSLIARMRLERELITKPAQHALTHYSEQLNECIAQGIRGAINSGELSADTPVDVVALPLVEMANSADPITRDASSFERLARIYAALDQLIYAAYGTKRGAG